MEGSDVQDESQHEQAVERRRTGSRASGAMTTQGEASNRQKQHRCVAWMNHHRLGWVTRVPEKWPRTCSLMFGVVLPLFTLIAVSLFFGYGLAKLEAPVEIEQNNDIIANRLLVHGMNRFNGNVTEVLPRICLKIFTQNLTLDEALESEIDKTFAESLERIVPMGLQPIRNTSREDVNHELPPNVDATELLDFMTTCGKAAIKIVERFVPVDINHDSIGEELSFNWIRCEDERYLTNESSSLLNQIWGRPFVNRSRLKPDVQESQAIYQWRSHYYSLYDEYRQALIENEGARLVDASIQAMRYAIQEANGFDHCYPNSAAGAWFWFTVTTTIGYGNTSPSTEGGRAMIYTLGFFSILLFAIILGTAGTIVVTIWDDFINRTKLYQLNVPWVACIFWGCCYYAWMLVIAVATQNWKSDRLDEEMEFSEAYWFAYISTTTVGLGDYFLEHEVILREDLITFPLLFLTGFVLLANFFVKLTEVISNLIPRHRPTLEERLATSDAPCLSKMPHARLKALGILHPRSKRTDEQGDDVQDDSSVEDTDEDIIESEVVSAVEIETNYNDIESNGSLQSGSLPLGLAEA